MIRIIVSFLALGLGAATAADYQCAVEDPVYPDAMFPQVKLETSRGDIVVELDRRRAPVTANNFLRYVNAGAYDGTVFHRVISDFVVQGGGYRQGYEPIEIFAPVMNEAGNGLRNESRTVAMARHDDPHSATSQFYFNLGDNEQLDPNRKNWGYAVFGRVTEGWDVVQPIASVATGYAEAIDSTDVPVESVVLRRVSLIE